MMRSFTLVMCLGSVFFLTACGSDGPQLQELATAAALVEAPGVQPPLQTKGRFIIDARGRRVKLASVNWYGASDERFVVGGLDVLHRDAIAANIAAMGFNSVRLPFSGEMVRDNPVIDPAYLTANPDLVGKRALDVFAAAVAALTRHHLMVIPNDHITQATWCCGANLCDTLWHNEWVPFCRVRQTEAQWIARWELLMSRFIDDPYVVGVDLRNEVRSPVMPWKRWAGAAERAGNRLLAMNPNWLMVVEGYHSGDDLTNVRSRPAHFDVPNRVVYSAHIYKWFGWGALHMYGHRSYASFASAMHRNWGYLLEENLAPVWVGEMGTPEVAGPEDTTYWSNLMRYLSEHDVDFAYWAINPRKPHGNTQESYSFLDDDWAELKNDYRLRDLQALQR